MSKIYCGKSSDEEFRGMSVSNVNCWALVNTGSDASFIPQDIYNKLDEAKLCRTSRILTGFGYSKITPIGIVDVKLIVNDLEYIYNMLVVPPRSMTSEVILGQDFLSRVELSTIRGVTTVRNIEMDKTKSLNEIKRDFEEESKDADDREDETANLGEGIAEMLAINFIEVGELQTHTPYDKKIKELISKYKPATYMKTAAKTKIILRNQEPICARPRQLSPKEKDFGEADRRSQ